MKIKSNVLLLMVYLKMKSLLEKHKNLIFGIMQIALDTVDFLLKI